MKKRLNDIFAITRNERIGLVCIIILIAVTIAIKAFTSDDDGNPIRDYQATETELKAALDSTKVDTLPRKTRKKKKPKVEKEIKILTASSLEKTETFE